MGEDFSNHFDFSSFLNRHNPGIIDHWVQKLHAEVGDQYAARPIDEITDTISQAVEANYQVLINNNFNPINAFIDKITVIRLEAGFLLSDVQKAFELYRVIVTGLLLEENLNIKDLHLTIENMNQCLAYTMHRFSDHFQTMHQKKILEQNKALEAIVKKRTAALQESEKKYKTLVEEINDGYFVIQDGVIVFANQAFCTMHGYSPEDVIAKDFSLFVAKSHQKQVLDIYTTRPKKNTSLQVFEYNRLVCSGEEFPTEIHGKTTQYDNKISSIGICRDITGRVIMEQKIRENERMAYIGQITASLSHEIRNPLSAVKMNLQILNKNQEIIGNDKRRVDISVSEVIRLEQILNELLDFAKPLQLNMTACNMVGILNAYIELLEIKFKEKELTVLTHFNEKISDLWVDREKVGQAVINYLINAIESSDPFGQIRVKYDIHKKENRSFARVTIDDDGQGFNEKDKNDMFKPFFTTKTKGVGLGLANVKRIIEAHKGLVSAKQRNPHGASFSLMIPIGDA
ncbi:MAG: PAS domain S-box protein [Desulfobacteraceae bacterium]|nr:PAS domain S-box protein [Desulfobacteraceae bacterium]